MTFTITQHDVICFLLGMIFAYSMKDPIEGSITNLMKAISTFFGTPKV